MTTTAAKVKTTKSRVEKLITLAKKQNLAAERLLLARLSKKSALKLFYEIAPRYKQRRGGYLRVVKASRLRQKDGSQMATIEFV